MGNSRAIYGHHHLCNNGPRPKFLLLLLWCSKTLYPWFYNTFCRNAVRGPNENVYHCFAPLVNFIFHLFITFTFHLFIKVPGKNVSFNSTLFLALFIFSKKCPFLLHFFRHFPSFRKKCLVKKCLRTRIPVFRIFCTPSRHFPSFQKSSWQKSVLYFCTFSGTFHLFAKRAW